MHEMKTNPDNQAKQNPRVSEIAPMMRLSLPTGLVPESGLHSRNAVFYPLTRLTMGGALMDYQTMLHESVHTTTFNSTWPTYGLFGAYFNGHVKECVQHYRPFVEAVAVAEALLRCDSMDYHFADVPTKELGMALWELCHRLPDIPCICGIPRALTLKAVAEVCMNHKLKGSDTLTRPEDVLILLGGSLIVRS